jgi:ribose-phosphate pyrophosphokinase
MPTTILEPEKLFLPIIREWAASEVTIVGPDAGGMKRAQRFARALDTDLAGIGKRRDAPDAPTPLHVMGNVDGRHCVVVDDMASTGQTLSSAAQVLTESGAETVDAVFTHAVMAEGALERLAESPLRHLVTSDTIPVSEDARKVVQVVPTSPSLARAILYATGGGEGST